MEPCCCDDCCGSVESVATNLLRVEYEEYVAAENCVKRGKDHQSPMPIALPSCFMQRRQQEFQTFLRRCSQCRAIEKKGDHVEAHSRESAANRARSDLSLKSEVSDDETARARLL